jgi:hypothetical protein
VNADNVFDAASAFRARALAAMRKMTNARARAGSCLVTREGQWRLARLLGHKCSFKKCGMPMAFQGTREREGAEAGQGG